MMTQFPEQQAPKLDLKPFFEGARNYAILWLPDNFPDFAEHSDIDILCGDRPAFARRILREARRWRARGFRVETHARDGHWHIDFFAPGRDRLQFRFDLLATLAGYKEFRLSPAFAKGVLDRRREVARDGVKVLVTHPADERALRCLEYVAWRETRPEKIKHWNLLKKGGNWDFIEQINRHSNLHLSVRRWWPGAGLCVKHKSCWRWAEASLDKCRPRPAGKGRLDYFLIWGHGTASAGEIIGLIRNEAGFRIVAIMRRTVSDVARFVTRIYSSDFVPLEHLEAKTKYLLATPRDLVLILAWNGRPSERFFGEGEFRHIQCERVKALKEKIRDRFNPRRNGKRTEDHVIHASDFESQTEDVLDALGLPPVAYYIREPNANFDAPYHLEPFDTFQLVEVDLDSLRISVLGAGLQPVARSPHYAYLTGRRKVYLQYHEAHLGKELTDDHFAGNFDRLVSDFNYGTSRQGKQSLILARRIDGGLYQILDGAHRAAILKFRGIQRALIAIPDFTKRA